MSEALNSWPGRLGAYALSVLVLISPALLNGFPFVLEDTMDYVALSPVLYRSTFYSVFVNITDLQISPWLPIIAQAVIVTHLLELLLRIWLKTSHHGLPLAAALLALGSSAAYVTSYLMPDIFTATLVLSAALLLFARDQLSKAERWYLSGLLCLSVSVHLSHIPILAITLAVLALARRISGEPIIAVLRRFAPVAAPGALAAALLFASHVVLFGIAKLSPAGPVFFLASLIGNGPAADYLKEACPAANYKICAEVDNLPKDSNSFLWGGMLYKLGWFESYREEAAAIVSETLKSRPLAVIEMSVTSFAKALTTHAPAEDFRPLGWNMWRVEASLSKYGHGTVEAFRASAQIQETIPKSLIRAIDAVVLPLSLVFLLAVLVKLRQQHPDLLWMTFATLTGITVNIFVCAAFSGVFDRYQTRVSWLIPLFALLAAVHLYRARAKSKPPVMAAEAA